MAYEITFDRLPAGLNLLPEYFPGGLVSGQIYTRTSHYQLPEFKLCLVGVEEIWRYFPNFSTARNKFLVLDRAASGDSAYVYGSKFGFKLPLNLPPSYSRKWGSISYYVEMAPNVNGFLNRKAIFTLMPLFNLSSIPELMCPVEEEKTIKTFGRTTWLPSSNHLNLAIYLPKKGFGGGELVPFKVIAKNESLNSFSLSIEIIQDILFRSYLSTQKSTTVIASMCGTALNPKSSKTWDQFICLPSEALPTFATKFISLGYRIQVTFASIGKIGSASGSVPIVVGTSPIVPLQLRTDSPVSTNSSPTTERCPSAISLPSYNVAIGKSQIRASAETSPPSYSDCMAETVGKCTIGSFFDEI